MGDEVNPAPAGPTPAQMLEFARTWGRRGARLATLIYTIVLVLGLAALEWWGERNWLLSLVLYIPPQTFLLPLLFIAPTALLLDRRLLLWHLGCVALVAFVFMTFRIGSSKKDVEGGIKIVTHNIGQGNRPQFLGFLDEVKPDVILLQDARTAGPAFAAKYRGSQVITRGEFVIVSRFPVLNAALVSIPGYRGRPVAARFELNIEGRSIVLFSVHMPTPRPQFLRFLSGRAMADLFSEETHSGARQPYPVWLAERRELARGLLSVIENEPLPHIAAGDFNMPDHGYIYHLFAGKLGDAFAASGSGWDLTFPGSTGNPVTFFGPWLRLDYFFTGGGWESVWCDAEPGRKSQHRAVAACFRPLIPKP